LDYKEFRERYQYDAVKDLLGQGGFGRVYKARDLLLDRQVALKVFSRDVPQQYNLISEIRRAIDLNHPNICRYFDAQVLQGTNALGESQVIQVGVMEYVEGGTIDEYLRRSPQHRKELLKDVLRGLSYLHHRQPAIIHRDLKPSNVLVGFENGVPVAKITDFGISKSSNVSGARVSVVGMGTYAYMAPEQLSPSRYGIDGKIQCNLDLWSYGVMTIELLTGVLPFGEGDPEASTGQIMESIIRGIPPQVLNGFEEPYRSVLSMCMIQDAGKRAQSATELLSLFEAPPQATSDQRRQTVVEYPRQQTVLDDAVRERTVSTSRQAPEPFPRQGTAADQSADRQTGPAFTSKPKDKRVAGERKHGRWQAAARNAIWPVVKNVLQGLLGLLIAAIGIGAAVGDKYFGAGIVIALGVGVSLIALAFPFERLRSKIVLTSCLFTLPFLLALIFWADARMVWGLFLGTEAICLVVAASWQVSPKLGAILMGLVFAGYAGLGTQAGLSLIWWAFPLIDLVVCVMFAAAWFSPRFRLKQSTPGALVQLGCVAAPIFLFAATPIVMSLAANWGDLSARQWLGESYISGKGEFHLDVNRGLALLNGDCDQGMLRACDSLGYLYEFGRGVPRHLDEAGAFSKRACDAGYSEACSRLSDIAHSFAEGNGVAANSTKSAIFYSYACNGGVAAACTNAGVQYEDGEGVAQDMPKAAALYQKACDGGESQGCSNLGNSYWGGRGVTQDKAKGLELLKKGCDMGNKWGCDRLKEMQ
jgi:serine/threonine protein kinase